MQIVAPKRAALAEANRKLSDANKKLESIRARVKELNDRVASLEDSLMKVGPGTHCTECLDKGAQCWTSKSHQTD